MYWKALPFVRLLPPFVVGIGFASIHPQWVSLPAGFFICLFVLTTLCMLSALARRWRRRHWFGIGIHVWLFFAGASLVAAHRPSQYSGHIINDWKDDKWLLATAEQVHHRGSFLKVVANTVALADTQLLALKPATGRLILYLELTDKHPRPGDTLLYMGSLDSIGEPLNPHAFNYRQFLHRQQIYFSGYARQGEWMVWGWNEQPGFRATAERVRRYCVAILQGHLPALNEKTVASALVLGYQDAIPDEVNQAYSYTGAMHVLSVSGLHVGLVYGALDMMLNRLKRRRWGRVARLGVLMAGIWAFAFITGAGAAVLRAATMFSMLLIGQSLHRRVNIYNTLAASAFLLLCIHPFLLFDMGFQLSYLALLGIVYFSPLIYKCWYLPWKPFDYIWQLTCVGIAAQLGTMPLSIYYFHQFPLYFWLSGWLVVPLAALILYVGCLLIALSKVPVIGMLLGQILNGMVWVLNAGIFWVRDLPGGQLRYLPLSLPGAILLYVSIIALAMLWYSRKGRWALWCLGALAAAMVMYNIAAWQKQRSREMVIYHIKGHTAIDLFDGRRLISWSDLPAGESQLEWACAGHRSSRYLSRIDTLALPDTSFYGASLWVKKGFIQLGHTRFAIIGNKLQGKPPTLKLKIDYLLLRANAPVRIDELSRYYEVQTIIADASNKPWRASQWQAQCAEAGIHFYDIKTQGAFCLYHP